MRSPPKGVQIGKKLLKKKKQKKISYLLQLQRQADRFWKRRAESEKWRQWRDLRYKALQFYGRVCQCCGAKAPEKEIHVDHIIPKSKRPDLALNFNNLQVLCADCNIGKSDVDETDFRPKT